MTEPVRVGIVANPGSDRALELAAAVTTRLESVATVRLESNTADEIGLTGHSIDSLDRCDLVISLGGDGTMLRVVGAVGSTPVVGVDLGHVGHLATVEPSAVPDAITTYVESARDGTLETSTRTRLVSRGTDWNLGPALNEIVLQGRRRGPAGGIEIEIELGESRYGRIAADGVIVATPTGSTAYNVSEGGPIVHPTSRVLLVTPMGDVHAEPAVIDDTCSITITLDGPDRAVAIADGATRRDCSLPETVTFEAAADPARLAGSSGIDLEPDRP